MVFKFHFGFGIIRTSDDLFSQSLRLKRHDYESQHPYLRQTFDISYCCLRACLNLAVLVLLRAIEGNDTAAAPGNGQQRRQGMRSRDAAWRLLFH